ncbi:MAG: Flp1 family type IVb pilin [Lachnospira sp.]
MLMKSLRKLWREEDGMGVVEVVLIIIVLIGLVVLFKNQVTSMVKSILSKMSSQANQV